MDNVYIIEAVRSPIGKRGKGLAGLMPADLLGQVQSAAINRSGHSTREGWPSDRRLRISGGRANL